MLGALVTVMWDIKADPICMRWHFIYKWWRHEMETLSALLAICARNSPVPGEFHAQRPVTWSSDVFFDLRLNKQLREELWGWWFETLSGSLWSHCNVPGLTYVMITVPILWHAESVFGLVAIHFNNWTWMLSDETRQKKIVTIEYVQSKNELT